MLKLSYHQDVGRKKKRGIAKANNDTKDRTYKFRGGKASLKLRDDHISLPPVSMPPIH